MHSVAYVEMDARAFLYILSKLWTSSQYLANQRVDKTNVCCLPSHTREKDRTQTDGYEGGRWNGAEGLELTGLDEYQGSTPCIGYVMCQPNLSSMY